MDTEIIDNKASGWRWWLRHRRGHRISTTERALIAAQGKALAMLATTLHSQGHLDGRRYADTLALFGAVVSEEDKLQGAILGLWAGAMEENLNLADAAAA